MPTYRIVTVRKNAAGADRESRSATVFAPSAHEAEIEARRTAGGDVRILGVSRQQEGESDPRQRRSLNYRAEL